MMNDLERFQQWRSEFDIREDDVDTFQKLDKLRKIDSIVWTASDYTDEEKLSQISEVLAS